MTWEETILHIRKDKKYDELVRDAFLSSDLEDNVTRYSKSKEFAEILKLIRAHSKDNSRKKILDIGSGNGISVLAFANAGYDVFALEPDPSETVGAGAIRKLISSKTSDTEIELIDSFAESIPLDDNSVDIVFTRQAMHHAADLDKFVKEATRVLKPDGIFFSVRDHVISTAEDLPVFLAEHPLHSYYGGENAFTTAQYENAMNKAGLKIVLTIKPHQSVINFSPIPDEILRKKMGFLSQFSIFKKMALLYISIKDKNKPGRLFSYLAKKQLL